MHTTLSLSPRKSHLSTLAKLALGLGAFGSICSCSSAAVVTYASAADFAAATSDDVSYSFPATSGGNFQDVSPSYADGPLTFGATFLYLGDDGTYGAGQTYLAATLGQAAVDTESVSLAGATALSFTFGSYYGASTVSVSVNGAAASTFSTAGGAPTNTFFGLTSTDAITRVDFTYSTPTNVGQTELDVLQFQVGSANAVPEPSTWALVGGAISVAAAVLHRRRLVSIRRV